MISILTGDIINSKAIAPSKWMPILVEVLNIYGKEPTHWEIYRGDSFQLEVDPELVIEAVLLLKASIKSIKGLDVRIGVGIGEKTYSANKITASNGSAFVNSGECFEDLKKRSIAIKSLNEDFNTQMNLMLELASLIIDNWTEKSLEIVKFAIHNKGLMQKDLAKITNKTQSAVSKNLATAGFNELMNLEKYYRKKVKTL